MLAGDAHLLDCDSSRANAIRSPGAYQKGDRHRLALRDASGRFARICCNFQRFSSWVSCAGLDSGTSERSVLYVADAGVNSSDAGIRPSIKSPSQREWSPVELANCLRLLWRSYGYDSMGRLNASNSGGGQLSVGLSYRYTVAGSAMSRVPTTMVLRTTSSFNDD